MKLPYLKMWDNTDVTIMVTDGLDENGAPKVACTFVGKCNYNEDSRIFRTRDGQLVELRATLIIGGDIAPAVPVITGDATVNGKTFPIWKGKRVRNPDGSIYSTNLELI